MNSSRLAVRILMIVASFAALMAGINGISAVAGADDATKFVETWRTVGFFTFAAFFSLLAYQPRQNKLLWLILIVNKIVLTMSAFVYGSSVAGASDAMVWDVVLVGLLVSSYILTYQKTSTIGQSDSAKES